MWAFGPHRPMPILRPTRPPTFPTASWSPRPRPPHPAGTDVHRIFLDRTIQRYLFAHAVEIGEDRAWLDTLFGRHSGEKDAIIQHVWRHRDHMHVRFHNARAQEWGRIAYPLLVKAGLAPGPTVTHRVRSGETLSHLPPEPGVTADIVSRRRDAF